MKNEASKKNPGGPNSITKTYDLIKWSIPQLKKSPRDQKFLLGDRIENHLLDVLELLLSANYSRIKLEFLKKANLKLEILRFLFRLAFELKYMNKRRYEYVCIHIDEAGRMVGGWIKQQKVKK